jgi:hypothetical protein
MDWGMFYILLQFLVIIISNLFMIGFFCYKNLQILLIYTLMGVVKFYLLYNY